MLAYDENEIEKQRRAAGKRKDNKQNASQIFTHYLMADDNAAKRIARAQQYKTSEEKL